MKIVNFFLHNCELISEFQSNILRLANRIIQKLRHNLKASAQISYQLRLQWAKIHVGVAGPMWWGNERRSGCSEFFPLAQLMTPWSQADWLGLLARLDHTVCFFQTLLNIHQAFTFGQHYSFSPAKPASTGNVTGCAPTHRVHKKTQNPNIYPHSKWSPLTFMSTQLQRQNASQTVKSRLT